MPHVCYKYAEKYGSLVQFKLFNTNVIIINSLELLQTAVMSDGYKQLFNDRPASFYGEHFLNGSQGVVVHKEGHSRVHSELRKVLIKGLHVYGDGTREFEEKVTAELGNVVRRIDTFGDGEFEFIDQIKMSFSNLLSILFIGEALEETDPDSNLFWEFNKALTFMFSAKADTVYSTFPFVRWIPGIYRDQYQNIVKYKQRIIERFYTRAKKTHEPGVIRGLVDFLLYERNAELNRGEDNIVLTEDRLTGLLLEVAAAGFVTSLCSLSNIILCLMNHPDCQRKVQDEIDHVIGRERQPTLTDRPNCPYLEAVVLEAQRLITVIPLSGPHMCRQNIEFEGYDVPANSLVLPNLNYIHHDKSVWGEDVWEFRPERFLDDNGQPFPRSHKFRKHWIPFSLGRRQCLGDTFARTRLFLYTATLLQKWTFIPVPGKCGPCDPRTEYFVNNLATRPKAVYCRVEKR